MLPMDGAGRDEDEIQFIGVLNVPPIESASDAVQAAIASGTFK